MATIALQLHPRDKFESHQGVITLYPREEAFDVWGRLLWNDEILLYAVLPTLRVCIATIIGKNLLDVSDAPMAGNQRLVLEVSKATDATTQTFDLGLLAGLQSGNEVSANTLAELRRRLPFVPTRTADSRPIDLLLPYKIDSENEITFAEDREGIRFISSVAVKHPFGEGRGVVRILLRQNGKPIAAAVIMLSFETNRRHEGELRNFGRDSFLLRRYSLFISRLYSLRNGHVRQRHYEWLLRAISYISPNIYVDPVSYISGASYDFIPAAVWAGFNVDIPRRKYGSFFYWKPVFANLTRPLSSVSGLKTAYRKLRSERMGDSWLVSADRQLVTAAFERGKWAISENAANKGRWRAAKAGDVMFFCVGGQFIIGAARISSTERMRIPGYERYPLGFNLSGVSPLSGQIDLSSIFSHGWLQRLRIGALVELPEEGHYALMELFENVRAGGRMWVRPNPYLLRRTQFAVTAKRAFIVQAWELRETICPIVRQVCEAAGWTVSHSGDREGQAIFDDIWAMLNEAEAVVVDFTKRRPNVYLEYGMALVLGKPIIAITQDEGDLPSDTPNLKFKKYRGDANAFMDLQEKLPRALIDTIDDIHRANEQYDRREGF